jgi:hypothetical protein
MFVLSENLLRDERCKIRNGMAHTALLRGRRHNGYLAQLAKLSRHGRQSWGVDSIVVGQEDVHAEEFLPESKVLWNIRGANFHYNRNPSAVQFAGT